MAIDARTEEEKNVEKRAALLGLPYYNTATALSKKLFPDILPKEELYGLRIIPLVKEGSTLMFGITNMTSQQTLQNLRLRFAEYKTSFHLISDTGYKEYMLLYDPPKQVVYQNIDLKSAGSQDLVSRVSGMLAEIKPDDMLAYLVQQAHNLNSSDIHVECQREDIRIRLRIDGVLHEIARIDKNRYRTFLSVVASAANISTSDPNAQQGHISQKLTMADGNTVDVNVRLETVPTVNGTDMVMRLFNMDASSYTLERLGLLPEERKVVDDIISKPSGLVLIVGPTGSGKTTTLYSMLNTLNTDERKIITVEDPVEYQFPGIVQIPLDAQALENGGFAERLKAILRLDPDIVMVGEIRDNATAKTALQASLTGHLVLSTFHASSAAGALVRLEDVIGQNPLFVSAIRLVMAQRLIRKLDDAVKQPYTPSDAEKAKITEVLKTLPPQYGRPDLSQLVLYKPGSSPENPYGYKGQIALREQFTMCNDMRDLLEHQQTTVSAQTIEALAIKNGMLTMLQKGILRVLSGETTLDEVYRVVG